jgi:hypothetical protein
MFFVSCVVVRVIERKRKRKRKKNMPICLYHASFDSCFSLGINVFLIYSYPFLLQYFWPSSWKFTYFLCFINHRCIQHVFSLFGRYYWLISVGRLYVLIYMNSLRCIAVFIENRNEYRTEQDGKLANKAFFYYSNG